MVFLSNNLDVFSWSTYKASGVDPKFICHYLNMNPAMTPKRQQPRRSSKEHVKAVKKEDNKLKQARGIKEVYYPECLANTMEVKKKSSKWRVCVNFTNLNKAYPKDPFLLPKIDELVNAIFGNSRMSFLHTFQGYHQIPLALPDQEKTAFLTPTRNCHYRVMPFGLKNASSTLWAQHVVRSTPLPCGPGQKKDK